MVARCVILLTLLVASATGSVRAGPVSAAQRFIPLLGPGDAIPPIPLVAQDGRAFTLADLHGAAVAVSFIFTRCADSRMCPLVSAKFALAQAAIGNAPIRLVLLSLDPSYDSPAVLARYGRRFGQNPRYWTLATGSPAMIDELAARLGIATAATAPGRIAHTEAAVFIAPDGRIARMVAGNDWSAADLVDYARASLPEHHDSWIAIRAWLDAAVERCGGSVPALGRPAMLGIFGLAIASIGSAFWFAFGGVLSRADSTWGSPSARVERRTYGFRGVERRSKRADRRQ